MGALGVGSFLMREVPLHPCHSTRAFTRAFCDTPFERVTLHCHVPTPCERVTLHCHAFRESDLTLSRLYTRATVHAHAKGLKVARRAPRVTSVLISASSDVCIHPTHPRHGPCATQPLTRDTRYEGVTLHWHVPISPAHLGQKLTRAKPRVTSVSIPHTRAAVHVPRARSLATRLVRE